VSRNHFLKHRFKSARKILKWALKGITVTVPRGPLKGKRWHLTTRSRFWQGRYEPHQTRLFVETVKPGEVVYDVGAHVGYYSVLASTLVGASGHVLAFEPVPANLYYLRRHLQINGCQNVTVIEACVAEAEGVSHFQTRGTGRGHISQDGKLTVRTVSLDELVQAGKIPAPDCIKIDVEGAEYSVLQGARALIARTHPTIFLSLHGEQMRQQCFEFLTAHGYHLDAIGKQQLAKAGEVLVTMSN